MNRDERLVVQVTFRAQEFPIFFRELRDMTANKQRASLMARLAYFGWLLERNGVQLGASPTAGPTADGTAQLVEIGDAPPIGEWLSDLGGSDGIEEPGVGTPAT